ncbi:MAG: lactonase family protein [Chloroflexota bacterium]|nr:lactonase family protein [Chloroflexota bacterium]
MTDRAEGQRGRVGEAGGAKRTREGVLQGGATLAGAGVAALAAGTTAVTVEAGGPVSGASAVLGGLALYVGTGARGEGVHFFRMDRATGFLTKVETTASPAPGWVTLDPQQRALYAAIGDNRVAGFRIDQRTGRLTPGTVQPTGTGAYPHISVDPSGGLVLGASYGAGTVGVLPILSEGQLGEVTHVVQHTGAPGPHPDQSQPRAHQVPFDPSGRWAVVTDLGLDRVYSYRVNTVTGSLTAADPPYVQMDLGRGPRHASFHPSGRWMYVINELDSTMSAFTWDSARGALREFQNLSALREGWTGRRWSAQVVVHPSGQWVYGSNRGSGLESDDIVVYRIDQTTGRMTLVGHQYSGGLVPRNFNIDPSGTFLLVAHQDGDTIIPFRINRASGMITPTGQSVPVLNPLSIQFAPRVAG